MKLIVKLLGAALLIISIAAAVWLVPAHLQVRQVHPPLPDVSQLRQLLLTTDAPTRISYLNTASQATPNGTLAVPAIVMQWSDGRLFMIDAGMDKAGAEEFAQLLETIMDAGANQFHGTVSDLLAQHMPSLAGISFTHLHIDHTQGVLNLCSRLPHQLVLLQTQYQRDLHNMNTEQGAAIINAAIDSNCLRRELLDGDKLNGPAQFPGMALFALGGHTPGSTLLAAASNGKIWLFPGDITNNKADILHNRDKGWLYSYLLVPEDTQRTAHIRQWLAQLNRLDDFVVVVSHDYADLSSQLPEFSEH